MPGWSTRPTPDVTDVMVNGRWLMRYGQLMTLDEGELLARPGNTPAASTAS